MTQDGAVLNPGRHHTLPAGAYDAVKPHAPCGVDTVGPRPESNLPASFDAHATCRRCQIIAKFRPPNCSNWLNTYTFPEETAILHPIQGHRPASPERFLDELIRHGTTASRPNCFVIRKAPTRCLRKPFARDIWCWPDKVMRTETPPTACREHARRL